MKFRRVLEGRAIYHQNGINTSVDISHRIGRVFKGLGSRSLFANVVGSYEGVCLYAGVGAMKLANGWGFRTTRGCGWCL